MSHFDYLADPDFNLGAKNAIGQAATLRRNCTNQDSLKKQRSSFLEGHGIKDARSGQGVTKNYGPADNAIELAGMNASSRSMEEALQAFPQFSARLLLKFELIMPMISRDDEPFYLFDNPARKDHIFNAPHFSAAACEGLSADAYQRAFPYGKEWSECDDTDAKRTLAYRQADSSAMRLFGAANDNTNDSPESLRGRLRFSSLWFKELQLLVINRTDAATGLGSGPVQFEAFAPGQKGVMEIIYFNPIGVPDSDEQAARDDLARWLGSVALWWPKINLGAKRLAGYGAIEPREVTLQAVGWSCLKNEGSQKYVEIRPSNEPKQLKELSRDGNPLSKEEFVKYRDKKLGEVRKELDSLERQLAAEASAKKHKGIKKKLNSAQKRLDDIDRVWPSAYERVIEHYADLHASQLASPEHLELGEKKKEGATSWWEMAQWIAGDTND